MESIAIESAAMPATKDDLKRFRTMLKSKPREYWAMDYKQYQRYLRDGVPAEFVWLLERPELLYALIEDSAIYRALTRPEIPADDE